MTSQSTRTEASLIPEVGIGKRGKSGHIAYLLRQAQGTVRHALDQKLASLGLTSPQFMALTLLDAYPGASGAELARLAQLTPQTMNLIVRKLERDGFIKRSEPGAYGRVLQLVLTGTGKSKLRQSKLRADAIEAAILSSLDEKHETIVREWLIKVAVQFEAFE
jgi:DNA-binding MarR family transcriptional regulator